MKSDVINYDDIAEKFRVNLNETLRNHSVSIDFLDLWVPDIDPIRGIANMLDSAANAGFDSIQIKVSWKLVPSSQLPQLLDTIGLLGVVNHEAEGEATVLTVESLQKKAVLTSPEFGKKRVTGKYWSPSNESSEGGEPGRSSPLLDFSNDDDFVVDDKFQMVFFRSLSKQDGTHLLQAQYNDVTLFMLINSETDIIQDIAHSVSKPNKIGKIMDTFCRLALNCHLQEVRDHTGLRTIVELQNEIGDRPANGIILPSNADPAFSLPIRLVRDITDQYLCMVERNWGLNYFHPEPSSQWKAMSNAEQIDLLRNECTAYLRGKNIEQDGMNIVELATNRDGHETRVVIDFADSVEGIIKPGLMRQLELFLRERVESSLELIAVKMRDQSKLRRL